MFNNPKNAFWQALILTIAVFLIGMFIGVAYEGNKVGEVNDYYVLSEISLMDSFALSKILDVGNFNCKVLLDSNIDFANRIYDEAIILERYETSEKLSDALKLAHRRYDLLRTLLWINVMGIPSECMENTSFVVYLYEYNTKDLVKKSENLVWSRILFDLKQEVGDKIILIPIAADSNLNSLEPLISEFNISEYPAVIIDNKHVFTEIKTVEEFKKYLK